MGFIDINRLVIVFIVKELYEIINSCWRKLKSLPILLILNIIFTNSDGKYIQFFKCQLYQTHFFKKKQPLHYNQIIFNLVLIQIFYVL